MTNDEKIAKALEQALYDDIAEYEKLPSHKFSRSFDRISRRKKLLAACSPREKTSHRSCCCMFGCFAYGRGGNDLLSLEQFPRAGSWVVFVVKYYER